VDVRHDGPQERIMVNIGIIGLGMMGRTHYEAYQNVKDARVVAVADADPKRAAGDLAGTGGNVLAGGLQKLPMDRIRGYTDWKQLLADKDVQAVDICLPTTAHREVALAAIASGKHVLCEKPLGRDLADARAIAAAAAKGAGIFMPAMCMRFWPGWTWLKQAVDEKRYGAVVAATFRRVAQMPAGWYQDGKLSGGAALDLHIHDVDFVRHLFGKPRAVFSRGYSKTTGATDHLLTQYLFDNGPLVAAEGGWCMADGFGFSMRYTVNFERATADFDLARAQPLLLCQNGKSEPVAIGEGTGYDGELLYFVECAAAGRKPTVVTAQDAVDGIAMVEAEVRSGAEGRPVEIAWERAASG
jgi:predicted dehydrogenase